MRLTTMPNVTIQHCQRYWADADDPGDMVQTARAINCWLSDQLCRRVGSHPKPPSLFYFGGRGWMVVGALAGGYLLQANTSPKGESLLFVEGQESDNANTVVRLEYTNSRPSLKPKEQWRVRITLLQHILLCPPLPSQEV